MNIFQRYILDNRYELLGGSSGLDIQMRVKPAECGSLGSSVYVGVKLSAAGATEVKLWHLGFFTRFKRTENL